MKKTGKIRDKQISQNQRKKNPKKMILAYAIGLVILIYFVYSIIQLIKQPTDIFAVENGSVSEEESVTRICDSR